MKEVYFDNNATTKVDDLVIAEMLPFFGEHYGNASSIHSFGGKVAKHISSAREKVAALINASPSEIIFTSCGTEGNNSAIKGTIDSYPEKKHIITTKVEHPAVLSHVRYLEKRGYEVTELGVDSNGTINLDELRASIRNDTAVVSVMYANNETGIIFPVDEIAQIVKERGSVFHCDAVQAAGKIPVDVKRFPVDLLTLSGHKIHAPKGIGALYIRKGTKFTPYLIGGHQERGRRGGTENVPYIAGFGKACELAVSCLDKECSEVVKLRDRLQERLLSEITRSMLNGSTANRLPNTLSISFEYVEGEAILLLLNEHGIAASSGSACTSGSLEPSHVLRAMGVPFTSVHGSVRFSLSRYSTKDEVEYVADMLPGIIKRLRDISPFGR